MPRPAKKTPSHTVTDSRISRSPAGLKLLLSRFRSAYRSDCRAVAALVKALRLCSLIGDPARAVVRLGQPEIGRADHAVGRPRQAHHGAQPGQAANIAAPDAQRRQQQPAHRDRPQQRPDVRHQALAVLLPRAAAHALPICWAKR